MAARQRRLHKAGCRLSVTDRQRFMGSAMAMTPRFEMKQSQGLVMTPQLQQAIRLLQLSGAELEAFVEGELERNPLLEREGAPLPSGDAALPLPESDGAFLNGPEADLRLDREASVICGAAENLDTDYDNLYDGDGGADKATPGQSELPFNLDWAEACVSGGSFQDSEYNLEERITSECGLRDHLLNQLYLAISDPVRQITGFSLIGMLDETGYLTEPLTDIAAQLGLPLEEVTEVLEILQGFEPAGVFARDLAECLALQLRERNRLDPAMQILLNNLSLLARNDRTGLMKRCRVDDEDLKDMIAEIRSLDPKPGLAYGGMPAQFAVPDVFVIRGPNGVWKVELNAAVLPKVLINREYCAIVSRRKISQQDRSFISECYSSANWLIKSLEQRARTILKVASELVRHQEAFFEHGVTHLRPLNLRTIADAIEMHESTVSRVTANKFIATYRGVFDMKYFFTSAIASNEGGDAHSAEAVRHRVKTLIDAERPDRILSDDQIVELLRQSGMEIARRTVAKYREAMRIPSSVERRRNKRIMS